MGYHRFDFSTSMIYPGRACRLRNSLKLQTRISFTFVQFSGLCGISRLRERERTTLRLEPELSATRYAPIRFINLYHNHTGALEDKNPGVNLYG